MATSNQRQFDCFVSFQRFMAASLVTIAPLAFPFVTSASELPAITARMTAQAEPAPSRQQILDACVQNQAETLPSPFTDVPRNHWAFKAVLTVYYCGAYRQATPPRLMKQRTEQRSPDQTTPVP